MKILKAIIFFFVCSASYSLHCAETFMSTDDDRTAIEYLKSLPDDSWPDPIVTATLSSGMLIIAITAVATICGIFKADALQCKIAGSVPSVVLAVLSVGGFIAALYFWIENNRSEQMRIDSIILASHIEQAYLFINDIDEDDFLSALEPYTGDRLDQTSVGDFAERLILAFEAGYFSSKLMFTKSENADAPKVKYYLEEYENFGLLSKFKLDKIFAYLLDDNLSKKDLEKHRMFYREKLRIYHADMLSSLNINHFII